MRKILLGIASLVILCSGVSATPVFSGQFKYDGRVPVGAESISNRALLTVPVAATSGTISFNAFHLWIDGTLVTTVNQTTHIANYDYDTTNHIFIYQITSALGEGLHSFIVSAQDGSGVATTTNFANVASNKFIMIDDKPIIFPSPATSNVKITYELSQNNDIELFIYNLNGQIVFHDEISSGQEGAHAGYNAYPFDLVSSYGEELCNGVYVVIVGYRDSSVLKILGKRKFIVLRE